MMQVNELTAWHPNPYCCWKLHCLNNSRAANDMLVPLTPCQFCLPMCDRVMSLVCTPHASRCTRISLHAANANMAAHNSFYVQ